MTVTYAVEFLSYHGFFHRQSCSIAGVGPGGQSIRSPVDQKVLSPILLVRIVAQPTLFECSTRDGTRIAEVTAAVNDHHEFGCARIDLTVVARQRTYLRITRAVGNAKFLIQNLLVASPTAGVRSLFRSLIET
jgi:hypothetical protein